MIELLTADTPNGKKVSIMLEEIKFKYKVTKINIYKDEQFKTEFRKISPFSKIPVIIDHDNNKSLFESGAILMYLGEKSGKFYEKDNRTTINQWLMGQMAYVGPMLGQHHQFHHYNPGKSEFGEKRYFKISKQIYKDLDDRLSVSNFKSYSIAASNVVNPFLKFCSRKLDCINNLSNIELLEVETNNKSCATPFNILVIFNGDAFSRGPP